MKNGDRLPGKSINRILRSFLMSQGWDCEGAGILNRGVDIEARRGSERWVIAIEGVESLNPGIPASFASALGKTLQIMNDDGCKYSVALPDDRPYRRLWERLPGLAKDRTGITALFVDRTGAVDEITG